MLSYKYSWKEPYLDIMIKEKYFMINSLNQDEVLFQTQICKILVTTINYSTLFML